MKKDTIYKTKLNKIAEFVFDKNVAGVFEDMINRSVPGYGLALSTIACLANQYVQSNSNCYDLGCSLGAATLAMRGAIDKDNVKIISVDNSKAMLDKCQENIKKDSNKIPIDIICDDICNIEIKNASLVVLNWTLQFVALKKRADLLRKIYAGIKPGGVIFIAEKIKFLNNDEQKFQEDLHCVYKKLNGYSDLEISQKRTALEDVLIPQTMDDHKERLKDIGFNEVYICSRCLNFVSFIAIKK